MLFEGPELNIDIFFLGTSAGVPTVERNVSSILIRRKGELIFFDIGEGTQKQIFKLGIGFGKSIKVFFTHIHGDHIFGLFPLLQTLTLFKRTKRLDVFAPPKLIYLIKYLIDYLDILPPFEIEMHEVYDGAIFQFKEYYVEAIKNSHTSWSFSYKLEEYGKPGKFNVDRAEKLRIPKIYWKDLSRGRDVILENGKYIRSKDFLIPPPIKGRCIVISGDTSPFERIVKFAENCDVLIHEATFTEDLKSRSIETLHTTAKQAAEIALRSNAKILVLTHFSARYEDLTPLLYEARKIFPATFLASDLSHLTIPYVKPPSYRKQDQTN